MADDLKPGTRQFGRYTLKEEVGRGGMGVVWLAFDERLCVNVALKFLAPAVVLDREAMASLRNGIKTVRTLKHPNIAKLHAVLEDKGRAALLMEWVGGIPLSGLLTRKHGAFSPSDLQPWLVQICSALQYAHNGVKAVHRNLKPDNILVTADGRVKITDFGIACAFTDSQLRLSTRPFSSTVPFMSPQQLKGYPRDPSDDCYAIGATIFALLTGEPPFSHGNITHQILNHAAPGMKQRRAKLGLPTFAGDEVWDELVSSLLSKEPSERPSIELLARHAGVSPLQGEAPSIVHHRSTILTPKLAAASVLCVMIVGLGSFLYYQQTGHTRHPVAAQSPANSETGLSQGSPRSGVDAANPAKSEALSDAPALNYPPKGLYTAGRLPDGVVEEKGWHLYSLMGREHVLVQDVAKFYGFSSITHTGNGDLAVRNEKHSLRFRTGSDELFINRVKFILMLPIAEESENLWISRADVVKLLEPILRPSRIAAGSKPATVVLIPFRTDQHSWSGKILESVVQVCTERLERGGFHVLILPGSSGATDSNARALPESVIIGLNLVDNNGEPGVGTKVLAPKGILTEGEDGATVYVGNRYDAENIALATALHATLVIKGKCKDSGVRRARTPFLKTVSQPAVEICLGCLSETDDDVFLRSSEGQNAIADSMLVAVDTYGKAISKKPEPRSSGQSKAGFSERGPK
jgi:serine/threonine protein kinase